MWRDNLDSSIKEHFEDMINMVSKEKSAYKNAKNPTQAQLWCAIAILSKNISDLELKIKKLEKGSKKIENKNLKKQLEKL
ncbi:MAG: hypothetical protein Q8Q35_02850 [Nanoarchaeota archaeon]|nr:hypothetical protein [Nanoarchaeota archaeon]